MSPIEFSDTTGSNPLIGSTLSRGARKLKSYVTPLTILLAFRQSVEQPVEILLVQLEKACPIPFNNYLVIDR